ncbi:transcriptional regulator [Kibdelosporangium philippinense]|uniref:Transcriptional regulator n=1 Tax=Kibdelosporangium philippinense TaxID=211113 RepID=A0ABS8ZHG0_9PSEU|nr:transcriptional regulator [Kibdelosporangium philippinense]MCE7006340.1 transcriptional regulator [Kibdelosporangium philippinense]
MGVTTLDRVAESSGLSQADTESELIDLAVSGLVTRSPGEFGGWSLTDAGRAADSERVAAELDTAGARAVVTKAYEDFLPLNPELLDLSTAWQMRSVDGVMTPNDHADSAYDARVLGRFVEFHQRADAVLAVLESAITRFGRHRARLGYALSRAQGGQLEYLVDRMDAYHTIWFQLHEDLLTTLGLSR